MAVAPPLFSSVWGAFSEVDPSTLPVHIRWLREKLEDDPADPKYIKTVYKVGYMMALSNLASFKSVRPEGRII